MLLLVRPGAISSVLAAKLKKNGQDQQLDSADGLWFFICTSRLATFLDSVHHSGCAIRSSPLRHMMVLSQPPDLGCKRTSKKFCVQSTIRITRPRATTVSTRHITGRYVSSRLSGMLPPFSLLGDCTEQAVFCCCYLLIYVFIRTCLAIVVCNC